MCTTERRWGRTLAAVFSPIPGIDRACAAHSRGLSYERNARMATILYTELDFLEKVRTRRTLVVCEHPPLVVRAAVRGM
jgi:hypothetical protein